MQRFFDILLALIALLVLAPVLIPVMLALRFTGEGEVFFGQQRVGRGGEPFGLLKFATMLKDSPNMGTGTVTLRNDPRVLPLGRLLRKTKINELPQLLNVLKGDMSIIGPRPQTRRCFEAFPPAYQREIVRVRPGLSGIGSIAFRGEEDMLEGADNADEFYDTVIMPYKGQLEAWYVDNRGLWLYFLLIMLTCWVVVFSRSTLFWRVFGHLPAPPRALEPYLYGDAAASAL